MDLTWGEIGTMVALVAGSGGVSGLAAMVLTSRQQKAKIESEVRIASQKAKLDEQVALSQREQSFSTLVLGRVDRLETRLEECEGRHARCEERISGLEVSIDDSNDRNEKLMEENAALAAQLRLALRALPSASSD